MSKYTDQLEKQLQAMKITQDSYDSWLDNECTKRFMLEIELDLQNTRERRISAASSVELAGIIAIERNINIEVLESVLEWKPLELEADE